MNKMALTLVMSLVAGLTFPVMASVAAAGPHKVLTLAHRGGSGYAPENTIAAFDKALKMKADYIEFDVQSSKDGVPVIMHDATVDRTTDGRGALKDLSFNKLRGLDAGSWSSPKYAGTRIPTLAEVLDRYRGKIGLLIEIKNPSLYPGIENTVAQQLRKRKMHISRNEKIMVQSFDQAALQRFHTIVPRVPIGLLTQRSKDLTEHNLRKLSSYCDFVNPAHHLVTEQRVDRIHSLGMHVLAWSVRDRSRVKPLIHMGVDGIITDFPDYV